MTQPRPWNQWREKPRTLCPTTDPGDDVCDCGYVGRWLIRFWTGLRRCEPTHGILHDDRPSQLVRRCHDCRRGGPGHDTIAGWEERCPRCGDVERFTMDGELIEARRNPGWIGSRSHDLDEQLSLLDED